MKITKLILYIFITINLYYITKSKSNFLEENYVYRNKKIIPNTYLTGQKIYYINDNFWLLSTNIVTDENDNNFFPLYKDNNLFYIEKKHNDFYPNKFIIINNDLFISCIGYLYKFSLGKDSVYNFEDRFSINKNIVQIKLSNNKKELYLYGCNLTGSSFSYDSHTKFQKFNIEENELSDLLELNDPEGFEFSLFQPRKFIDVNDKYIIITNSINRNLYIYDHNGKEILQFQDTLMNNIDTHKELSELLKLKLYKELKIGNFIDKIRDYNKKIELVHNIWSLNDSTFIRILSKPKQTMLPYDIKFEIWQITNNKLILINSYNDIIANKSEILTNYNIGLYNQFEIQNDYLVYNNDQMAIEIDNNISYSDYLLKTDEYFKINDIANIYFIYTLKK